MSDEGQTGNIFNFSLNNNPNTNPGQSASQGMGSTPINPSTQSGSSNPTPQMQTPPTPPTPPPVTPPPSVTSMPPAPEQKPKIELNINPATTTLPNTQNPITPPIQPKPTGPTVSTIQPKSADTVVPAIQPKPVNPAVVPTVQPKPANPIVPPVQPTPVTPAAAPIQSNPINPTIPSSTPFSSSSPSTPFGSSPQPIPPLQKPISPFQPNMQGTQNYQSSQQGVQSIPPTQGVNPPVLPKEPKKPANYIIGQTLPPKITVKVPTHNLNFDEQYFLRLLAGSISLTKDEKKKIIESIPRLKQRQIDELIRIFEEEKRKFAELSDEHIAQLKKLESKNVEAWRDIEMEQQRSVKAQEDEKKAEEIRKSLGL